MFSYDIAQGEPREERSSMAVQIQRKTKQGNLRWYLDYRDEGGKRVQRVVPYAVSREEAAVALERATRNAFNRSQGLNRTNQTIAFSEYDLPPASLPSSRASWRPWPRRFGLPT
jgi:hypothetical protein